MDLLTLTTFISLSTVEVVLTTIGSNVSTSCNGLMTLMSVMAVMAAMAILTVMAIMAVMAIIALLYFLASLDCLKGLEH